MNIRKVKKLIELLQETGIGEIEIREGEESVRISRYYMQNPATVQPVMATVHSVSTSPSIHPSASTLTQIPKAATPNENSHVLKSPMVGTVYLSAAPGEKPFVEVGKVVSIGDTLCVIEAMKMFNQIEADKAGVVSARLIDNGNPVEYDQPLFIIED